jgi:iron complex outermembrane receptor protein
MKTSNKYHEIYSSFLIKGALIIILLTSASNAFSFKTKLNGVVSDANTLLPVENASVQILETNQRSVTDENGIFSFSGIDSGQYTVVVKCIGYKEEKIIINIESVIEENILFKITPTEYRTPVIIVTDEAPKTKFETLMEATSELKGKELQLDMGNTLASTLKNETGLSIRSMGPAPSRPVFRGLSGDRVLISEDGTKTADLSATSPDHSVTVEPFTVQSIQVLRGPKVLLKTSTTIGGVVNVVRNEIPVGLLNKPSILAGFYGETVNKGYLGSLTAEVPFKNLMFRGEGSYRKADNLKTPEGTLINSQIKTINYSTGISFIDNWGYAGISYREFKSDYGIPGGFIGAHPKGVNISMDKKQYNSKLFLNLNNEHLENINASFSRVYYHHTEFEGTGLVGAEFGIINYLGDISLNHKKLGLINNGTLGFSFEHRDFNIGGYVFSPPTKSIKLSGYYYGNILHKDKMEIEFSARLNHDIITPEAQNPESKIGKIQKRTFNTFSLALSAIYDFTGDIHAGLNLSRSSRVPTIEELFSEGPHLAAYSFETGNPNLESERGTGSELFLYYKTPKLFIMLNGFYNYLPYYIITQNSGVINYATLLPVYISTGVKAVLYGFENQIDWTPFNGFDIFYSLSCTIGKNLASGSPLPSIPPVKSYIEAKYTYNNLLIGVSSELAEKQSRVDIFEQPTAGYAVFNTFAQYIITTGKLIHSFSINADNIFNTVYRNHLSRVKSIMPEPGFNVRVTYKLFY